MYIVIIIFRTVVSVVWRMHGVILQSVSVFLLKAQRVHLVRVGDVGFNLVAKVVVVATLLINDWMRRKKPWLISYRVLWVRTAKTRRINACKISPKPGVYPTCNSLQRHELPCNCYAHKNKITFSHLQTEIVFLLKN